MGKSVRAGERKGRKREKVREWKKERDPFDSLPARRERNLIRGIGPCRTKLDCRRHTMTRDTDTDRQTPPPFLLQRAHLTETDTRTHI